MRLPIENDTKLNLSSVDISFSEDIFQDEDFETDPVFCNVKSWLDDLKEEREVDFGVDPDALDELKMEHYLTESELKQWKKLSKTERHRILRKVYQTEEYQGLKEILAQYRSFLVQQPERFYGAKHRGKQGTGIKTAGPTGKQNVQVPQSTWRQDVKEKKKDAVKSMEYKPNLNEALPMQNKDALSFEQEVAGEGNGIVSQGMKAAKKAADIFKEGRQFIPQEEGGQQEEQYTKSRIGRAVTMIMSLVTTGVTGPLWFILIALIILVSLILLPILAIFADAANEVADNPGVMPYYAQADYPTVPFNGGTVKSSGCGITSMAMVASLFKGEAITPPMLAQMANADPAYNTVQSHQAINKFAEFYELGEVEEMGGPSRNCCGGKSYDLEYIKKKIAANCPVIVSVTGGYYNPSGGGHYIALYGSGKGGVFVYDPGSRSKYQESLKNDGSDWKVVFSNSKHIWIFQPYAAGDIIDSSDGTNCMMVYLYLKQAGFSDAAASGVIGNMWQECAHGSSDLRPAMESADGSIGLLQWSGGRRTALENLAANRNSNWMDISVQIEYLLQEINSGTQWIWKDYASEHYPEEDDLLLEEYKQLDDPEKAAEVFCAKFVRPDYEKANLEYRKAMARQFYTKIISN